MNNYFRAQVGSYTLEQMQSYVSEDGADDGGAEGICACLTVSDLLNNTVMDAMDDDDEVVVLKGIEVTEIYDGYRIYPTEVVARFTVAEFMANTDAIAEKYETL